MLVLAVSGLHAGIIYLILAFVTAPLSKKKYGKAFQVVLILFGIWLYAFMTGLSSSVLRASIMFSFMAIGKLLKYHVNIYNNIFSSAFILLLYNPLFIIDVGFQLSYLAVIGIVLVQPMINKWYTPKYWLGKYVWSLVSVSFAAQLLTFPISIFIFSPVPELFHFFKLTYYTYYKHCTYRPDSTPGIAYHSLCRNGIGCGNITISFNSTIGLFRELIPCHTPILMV